MPDEPSNVLEETIEWSALVGPITEVKAQIGDTSLLINAPPDREYHQGSTVRVYISRDKTIVLP